LDVQVNTWDDHDTFDGWGSYPADLQKCPLFEMIFEQSQRFYTFFQQGTTIDSAAQDGLTVIPPCEGNSFAALNFATQLGPSLGLVAPDSRSQRSSKRILSEGTYNWLFSAVRFDHRFKRSCRNHCLLCLQGVT
jgi:hypothetical protein